MLSPLTIITFLFSFFSLLAPTTAYFSVALRSKRCKWFGSGYAINSVDNMKDNTVDDCQQFANVSNRGAVNAVTIYNKPNMGTSAVAFAFYDDQKCGGTKRHPILPDAPGRNKRVPMPLAVAILDPADPDGVWLIDTLKALRKAAADNIQSMKALDYEAELRPGGLLEGIEDNPPLAVYKWDPRSKLRESVYIPRAITRLQGPDGDIGRIENGYELYMNLRHLGEIALRPGPVNPINRLSEYFERLAEGEDGEEVGEKEGEVEGKEEAGEEKEQEREEESEERNEANTLELEDESEVPKPNGGLENPDSRRKRRGRPSKRGKPKRVSDAKLQRDFIEFLNSNEEEVEQCELESSLVPTNAETTDDQTLVKAGSAVIGEEESLASRARTFQDFMNKASRDPRNGLPILGEEWVGGRVQKHQVKIQKDGDNINISIIKPSGARPEDAIVLPSDEAVMGGPQEIITGSKEGEGTRQELRAENPIAPQREAVQVENPVASLIQQGEAPTGNHIAHQREGSMEEEQQLKNPEGTVAIQQPEVRIVDEVEPQPEIENSERNRIEEEEPELQIIEDPALIQQLRGVQLPISQAQAPAQAQNQPADLLNSAPPIWDGIASSVSSRQRERFDPRPEYLSPQTSTSRGWGRRLLEMAQIFPQQPLEGIEDPVPLGPSNANNRDALANIINMDDDDGQSEGSFADYEGYVSGRRRQPGN